MKKLITVGVAAAFALTALAAVGAAADKDPGDKGEELFENHCAVCHPGGGNIINPAFTLHKKDRDKHGVTTAKDIIDKMRNPGPGMTKFDKNTISNKDAKAIADYVLKTFN